MARTENTLRGLARLSRRIFSTQTAQVAEGSPVLPAQGRLQALATEGGCDLRQQAIAITGCPSSSVQQLLGVPFAALSLQLTRQPVPLACLVQFSAQRQPHQVAVVEWFSDNDSFQKPQSIGSIAKYGDEDVNLTRNIILTPTRESDRNTTPPAVTVPLKADSVRRKRKHKMNKHKHKKRRKLQRHKN